MFQQALEGCFEAKSGLDSYLSVRPRGPGCAWVLLKLMAPLARRASLQSRAASRRFANERSGSITL
jgi:hypothetical protein